MLFGTFAYEREDSLPGPCHQMGNKEREGLCSHFNAKKFTFAVHTERATCIARRVCACRQLAAVSSDTKASSAGMYEAKALLKLRQGILRFMIMLFEAISGQGHPSRQDRWMSPHFGCVRDLHMGGLVDHGYKRVQCTPGRRAPSEARLTE